MKLYAPLLLALVVAQCLAGVFAANCKPSFFSWGFYDEMSRGSTFRRNCAKGCTISDRRADQSLTTLWGGDGKASLPGPCVISVTEGGGSSNVCSLRTGTISNLGSIKFKTTGNCRVSCGSTSSTEIRCCNSADSKDCYIDT